MSSAKDTRILSAGNTLAPALAVLKELGFVVSREGDGQAMYVARRKDCVLGAEDPLSLLGLAKLYEARGSAWQPSESEVSEFLLLETRSD